MKNTFRVIIALIAVIGFSMAACDSGSDSTTYDPIVYESVKDDTTYKLEITKNTDPDKAAFNPQPGDNFKMTITKDGGSPQTSSGTIQSFTGGNTFTLQCKGGGTFTVTTGSGGMSGITGDITLDNGTKVTGPGSVTPKGEDQKPSTGGEDQKPSTGNDVVMTGTTWVWHGNRQGIDMTATMTFTATTWTYKVVADDGTPLNPNDTYGSGTYTVKGNVVTLRGDDNRTGVVNGNTLILGGFNFIKQ